MDKIGAPGTPGGGDAGARAAGYKDYADYMEKTQGQNGSFGLSIPSFSFDTAAAQKSVMAQLQPYYQQLLDLNNGDIDRAKASLESDYQSGKRYLSGELSGQNAQEAQTEQGENESVIDDLNKRGVLFGETPPKSGGQRTDLPVNGNPSTPPSSAASNWSGIAQSGYIDPLQQKQQLRQQAIQRAITRQQDVATNNYTTGMGDQTSKGKQYQLTLDKEMQDQTNQQVQSKYQNAYNTAQFGTNTALSASNNQFDNVAMPNLKPTSTTA